MNRLRYIDWSLIFIFILGLTPLVWYREGLVIAGGDNYRLLNPANFLNDFTYAWNSRINEGIPNLETFQLFPFVSFWVFFTKFGLSLVNVERLWSVSIFLTSLFSIYFLFSYLIGSKGLFLKNASARWGALGAATFYTFNMWVSIDVITPVARLIAAVAPIIILLWIKGLEAQRFSLRYPILIGITSVFLASTFAHPVSAIVIPLACLLYLAIFLLLKKRYVHALKYVLAVTAFLFSFNLWWILPYLSSAGQFLSGMEKTARSYDFLAKTHIFEAFRFMGFWAFQAVSNGVAHIPYSHFYYEPAFLIVGFLLPVLALSTIMLQPRDKNVLFLTLLGLIGVFFSKGTNYPFGFIYSFLFYKVPFFSVFREPFARFTGIQVLAFSLLLGIFIRTVFLHLENRWGPRKALFWSSLTKFWPAAVTISILVLSFPLLTGRVIQDSSWRSNTYESLKVIVPDYWRDLAAWLSKNDPQAKVLVLPRQPYGTCYKWQLGACTSGPAALALLSNPLIIYPDPSHPGNLSLSKFYELLDKQAGRDFSAVFDLFRVSYVLVQNDLVGNENGEMFPVVKTIGSLPNLQLKKKFGLLDLYEYKGRRPYRQFAIPSFYELSQGSGEFFPEPLLFERDGRAGFNLLPTDESLVPKEVTAKGRLRYVEPKISLNQGQKKYSFDLPEDGRFELFNKRSGFTTDFPRDIFYKIENFISEGSSLKENSRGWESLGRSDLGKGSYSIEINFEGGENLASSEGFFNGIFYEFDRKKEKDVPVDLDGGYWYLPGSSRSNVGVVAFTSVEPGASYKISFWYKDPKKALKYIGVQHNSCSMPVSKKEFQGERLFAPGCKNYYFLAPFESRGSWQYFETNFKANEDSRTALLFFELVSSNDKIFVGNVVIERTFESSFALVRRDLDQVDGGGEVAYTRLNPSKYIVSPSKVAAPYEIVFREGFNKNWKAYLSGSSDFINKLPLGTWLLKPLNENHHFSVNGYANGWVIDKASPASLKGDYKIIVEYSPERLYFIGKIFLLLSLLFSCFYFLVPYLKVRRD